MEKNKTVKQKDSNKKEQTKQKISEEALWNFNNYILLKDYYDRTISRISARCIRMGNIAIEDYPHYSYILDVLEEITDTGEFIVKNPELKDMIESKIKGGMAALKKNLQEFKDELEKNKAPDLGGVNKDELNKFKNMFGEDPTKGAGMNADDIVDKLMKGHKKKKLVKKVKVVKQNAEMKRPIPVSEA